MIQNRTELTPLSDVEAAGLLAEQAIESLKENSEALHDLDMRLLSLSADRDSLIEHAKTLNDGQDSLKKALLSCQNTGSQSVTLNTATRKTLELSIKRMSERHTEDIESCQAQLTKVIGGLNTQIEEVEHSIQSQTQDNTNSITLLDDRMQTIALSIEQVEILAARSLKKKGPRGKLGPMPRHEIKTENDVIMIRFESSIGHWGAWIEIKTPRGFIGGGTSFRLQIQEDGDIVSANSRILNFEGFTVTAFDKGVTISGGGGLSTVETDNTIDGDGSVAEPLHLYGLVNSLIADELTVQDNQVLINSEITIALGSSITIEPGGQVILLPGAA